MGSDRLPALDDYENLPYIRCCIKESMRWMPTVLLGVPHAAIKEDSYNGYRFPAGATVINNVWYVCFVVHLLLSFRPELMSFRSIHMDSHRSPEPRRFNPDRFADDKTSLFESATGDSSKRDNFVFGAGRRLCQGIHIAERSLFYGISRLVWAFDFSPSLGADGRPITYDVDDLVGGITVEPRPYTCQIKPRSKLAAEIICKEAEACSRLLDKDTGQWKETPEGMAFSTWTPERIEA